MNRIILEKILPIALISGLVFVGIRFLLPVALPFFIGGAIALLAESAVGKLSLRMPRWCAATLCVSIVLGLLVGVVSITGAILFQQAGKLAPEMAQTAKQGLTVTRDWLLSLSNSAPQSLRPSLEKTVTGLFSDGSVLLEQATRQLPGVVTTAIGTVGNGVLSIGTGVLAAFLISFRLPQIRQKMQSYLPGQWKQKYLPVLQRVRVALGGWLKAQVKLCAITWGIVSVGFLLMRIPQGAGWALVVAIVDAVPVLGTGTVLVPWAVVCLIKKESLRAIGLLCTYGAAMMTRTVLEPRLMGKQLGLDPLTTLVALYAGYRFWGFTGLLLTPILASAAKSILTSPT